MTFWALWYLTQNKCDDIHDLSFYSPGESCKGTSDAILISINFLFPQVNHVKVQLYKWCYFD